MKVGLIGCFKSNLYWGMGIFLHLDATEIYGRMFRCYFEVWLIVVGSWGSKRGLREGA